MRAWWPLLLFPSLAACGRPPGRCGTRAPIPPSSAKLECAAPSVPALNYAEGAGLLDLIYGRRSKVAFEPAATRISLLAGDYEYPVSPNELDHTGTALSLSGGPCASGCNVSPSLFLGGRPSERLTVRLADGRLVDWQDILVFGGRARICVEPGGVMTLPPGALMLQFNGFSSDPQFANNAWWMGFRNSTPARVRVDFEARRFELSAELCEQDGADWGLSVSTQGKITNVPPVAVTAGRIEVACTSHRGASVTLDASRSHDADRDPLTFSWWKNGVGWNNQLVRAHSGDPKATVIAPPGATTYWVDVMQDLFTSSQAPLEVVVLRNESCASLASN